MLWWKNVLRYTQNSRRKDTKKTKYKKIRKTEEENTLSKLQFENDFLTIEENQQILSKYNSRTMDTEQFKNYIKEKNLFAMRFGKFYQENFYRKLNFNTKINRKSSEDRFLERFKNMFGTP